MLADLRLGRWQDVLAYIPDCSVRLILTSPPYDNARTYEGTNEPVDFGELATFCLRVLIPGGVVAMVLDGSVNEGRKSVTPHRVICDWDAIPGWRFLQDMVYGRHGAPGRYEGRFRRDHEPIIVFVKDGADHVCNKDALSDRSRRDMQRNVGFAGARRRDGRSEVFGMSPKGVRRDVAPVAHVGSVWWYGMVGHGQDPSADTGHPATFAEAFARDAVTVWSNPGDLVVDPFAGSATVLRASIDLGRRSIGAERVGACPACHSDRPGKCGCPREWKNYYAIGMQRLAQQALSIDMPAEAS